MSIRFVNGKFVPINKTIAFVTFSNGRYLGNEKHFEKSVLNIYPDAGVFCFHDFYEIGSPDHNTNPYAFKVYCIEKVRSLGYSVIIWSDCINRLEKSIKPILEETYQKGVYIQGDKHGSGIFANDRSLSYFGVTRDEAMDIEAIYACIMIFDFRNPITSVFFERWKQACKDGIFKGHWSNEHLTESQDIRCKGHRHDQTCVELISHQLNIPRSRALLGNDSEHYFSSFRYPVKS